MSVENTLGRLRVETEDGSRFIIVTTLIVPNGSLEAVDLSTGKLNVAGIATAVAGGADKQVQFNNVGLVAGAVGFEYQSGASPNVQIQARDPSHTPLALKSMAGQAVPLLTFLDDTDAVRGYVSQNGQLALSNNATAYARLTPIAAQLNLSAGVDYNYVTGQWSYDGTSWASMLSFVNNQIIFRQAPLDTGLVNWTDVLKLDGSGCRIAPLAPTFSQLTFDAFENASPAVVLRRAAGVRTSPTAVVGTGQQLGQVGFAGFLETGYTGVRAAIRAVTLEDWSTLVNEAGLRLDFATTAAGSNIILRRLSLDEQGLELRQNDEPASNATSGYARLWVDAVTNILRIKDDVGTVSNSVRPQAAVANSFLTSIDANGVVGLAQPTFQNLAGNISVTQMDGGLNAAPETVWSGDGHWTVAAVGDMVLAAAQEVTGSKTFLPGALILAETVAYPAVVPRAFFVNAFDHRLYFGKHDGSAWAEVALAGVSGPIATSSGGTGLPGGFAKGDLLVALDDITLARFPVGANGNAIIADDLQPSGIKWGTIISEAGDMTLAGIQTVTGAKTFLPGALILAETVAYPPVVPNAFFLNAFDHRLYFGKYDGSAWAEIPLAGISGPIATSSGGTGLDGSAFLKGDLLVATGPYTLARLRVGNDDLVLVADDSKVTGMRWSSLGIPADVMTLSATQNVTGAKTFDAGTLIVGANIIAPTVVARSFFVNSADGRLYFGKNDGSAWAEIAVAGVSGAVSESNGGTGKAGGYTKGDVLVATGSSTLVKLAVGANGTKLTADSAEASGMKWV